MKPKSVADIEGPWCDPNFDSGLILRCKRYWTTPVSELTNEIVATYLRQKIALEIMIPEAQIRLNSGVDDDCELYEGELADALSGVINA